MKKIVLLLICAVSLFSCSQKPKDLIVKTWQIKDVTIPNQTMSDSDKAKILKGTIEFTKDGKMIIRGMGDDQTGNYTLSEDGKTLTVVTNGKSEDNTVEDLTSSKLVLTSKNDGGKLTAVPK